MNTPEATLEAVDTALAAGRVTEPEVRELQELALALRAESPRPDADFERRLDERVAAGFPRRRFRVPRPSPPLLGGAVAAVAALVVGVSLIGRGGSSPRHEALKLAPAPSADAGVQAAGRPGAAVRIPHGFQALPALGRRHVERSASLTLAAPRGRLDTVGNEIVAVVDRHLGFVLHSSVTSGESGYFDLRIPTSQLQSTLRDLSALADVRSRSQNLDDITLPYNDTADRLAAQRALRQSLLNRLAQATSDTEARALRTRLRLVSASIRALTQEFDSLRQRASYASVSVTLIRKRGHRVLHGSSAIGGDFHRALHSLAVSFGIALRVIGVLIPLAFLGGLAWLAAAWMQRRRREAALL